MRVSRRVRLTTLAGLAVAYGAIFAAPSQAVHQTVYGLTTQDPSQIVSFPVGQPQSATGPTAITGLTALGDNLIGIDYRPASNDLYAEADNGQLYTIAPPAGAVTTFTATPVSTATDPADVDSGVGFNPVADRLRVNNVDDEDFRINVDNGVTIADGALAFAAGDPNAGDNPEVGAADYTNSFDGAATTTLYDIETGNDVLTTQNPPNNGTLNTVGSIGVAATSIAGLDIEASTNNTAYAALNPTASPASRGSTASIWHPVRQPRSAPEPVAGGQPIESVTLAAHVVDQLRQRGHLGGRGRDGDRYADAHRSAESRRDDQLRDGADAVRTRRARTTSTRRRAP